MACAHQVYALLSINSTIMKTGALKCLVFSFCNRKLTHFFPPQKKPLTSQLNPEIRRQPCFLPLRPPYSRNGLPVTELTVIAAAEVIFFFKVHLQWGDPVHFRLHC